MKPPLVSIIIPCHNAAPWLAETIGCALAQTWPTTEIIVINDGSTDQSLAIARGFAERGVRVIDQPNRGASAARNQGVRESEGEFLQFLDADDLISPSKIAAQIDLLQAKPAGTLATCAWGRFERDPQTARFVDQAVYRDFAPIDFLLLAGETGAMMHPSSWLIPRGVADLAGPWNEALSLNDDGEYFARVLLASAGLIFEPAGRSYYRSGLAGSLSQQRSERARRSQYHALELITLAMLSAENSPRTRRAAATFFQRFIHDFFPFPADLMQAAEVRVRSLGGGALTGPPMGPKTAALARLIGWRNVWRLKHRFSR